jgi:POT family proton-dependent oligopeptide transporter
MVPPTPPEPDSFLNVAHTTLLASPRGRGFAAMALTAALASLLLIPPLGVVIALCCSLVSILLFGGLGMWRGLDAARADHEEEAIEGVRTVLRVLVLFALVTPFWSLFDQKASTWVLQADAMSKPSWFQSSQMQALNPLLVMLLIPLNNLVLYPALKRRGYEMTALRRMTAGIAFSGLAWVVVAGMQLALDGGHAVSIVWQVLPYALLTLGEVLVSATGLEFAYSQAPAAMKGVLMSFWNLAVTIGNLWVLVVNAGVRHPAVTHAIASTGFGVMACQMFFFAAFAFAAALVFGLVARRYPVKDYYRAG